MKAATPGLERLPFAARNAAVRRAEKVAIESNRSCALAGTMGLHPSPDLPSGLIEASTSVFVASRVKVSKVVGETHEEPELLDSQVGPRQGRPSASSVCGLQERFQDIERGTLNTVAEEETLGPREPVEGGHQPQDKAVVEVQRRTGLAGPVSDGVPARGLSRRFVAWLAVGRVHLSKPDRRMAKPRWRNKRRPGGCAPWTPAPEIKR